MIKHCAGWELKPFHPAVMAYRPSDMILARICYCRLCFISGLVRDTSRVTAAGSRSALTFRWTLLHAHYLETQYAARL